MNRKSITRTLLSHSFAVFTILVWGITFLSTKYLADSFSALEILFIRYAIAYLFLWILHPKFEPFRSMKEELLLVAAGLSGAAVYQYLENLSIFYTSPASVSFLTAVAPLFTALLARVWLKEKLPKRTLPGMLVSLVGVFFICFGDSKSIETGLLGDVIILSGVWLWAVYSILIKLLEKYGRSQFAVTRRIFFYSLIALLPFMIPRFGAMNTAALISPVPAANLLFLGALASAVCFATWNKSVEVLGPTTTSKYLFVMPIITLIAEAILYSDPIHPAALAGMAVTLVGVFIAG